MNTLTNLSIKQLKQAIKIKNRIETLQKSLIRILAVTTEDLSLKTLRKQRKMSATARKKISVAAKARWARVRGKRRPSKTTKTKRKISAVGITSIRVAQKARWAKIKAQKK